MSDAFSSKNVKTGRALPASTHSRHSRARWDICISRLMDISVSLVAMLIILPVILLIIIMIKLTDHGPILYAQPRIGIGGKQFRCLKLRSMIVDSDRRLIEYLQQNPEAQAEWDRDHKLRYDPRITWLGRLIRKSSLDELPQFLNVLRGDMSLVGPRPIVQAEAARYGRYFQNYCSVKPGITGLWQISGRSNTTYRRRIVLDVMYSRRQTFVLDVLIILRTIPAVILASGSY